MTYHTNDGNTEGNNNNNYDDGGNEVEQDTTAPILTISTQIGSTTNTSPSITINSNEVGSLSGSVSSSSYTYSIPITTLTTGNNVITFINLPVGEYNSSSISVSDSYGNTENYTNLIPSFTISEPVPDPVEPDPVEPDPIQESVFRIAPERQNNTVYIVDRKLMQCKRNPRMEFIKLVESGKTSIPKDFDVCENGVRKFKEHFKMPLNLMRKISCPVQNDGTVYRPEATIEVFKDNLALNCACRTKPNPPNPNFISSYKTLNERRNRTYESNLKFPYNNYLDKQSHPTKINKTVVKYNNPRFNQTGAVSSRNRIAALKNGNKFNNIYKTRCDTITSIHYKKKVEEKKCKARHYGGKWKYALVRCPPKN